MTNAHPRGLSRPEASTSAATSPKQDQPARVIQRSKASALPKASNIAKNVLQHLSAEARPTAAKSPAPTRQAKRPPAASNEEAACDEEASTSESTPTKKLRRKAPARAHNRAQASLNFGAAAERASSQSASDGAQQDARTGGNSSADQAPEQPLQQAATRRVQGRPRKQAQPTPQLHARAAKQLLELRQLRPRPAVAAAAPGTPPKPAEAPARRRSTTPKQTAAKTPCKRVPLQECEVEGLSYRVGDTAYIVTDENFKVSSLQAYYVPCAAVCRAHRAACDIVSAHGLRLQSTSILAKREACPHKGSTDSVAPNCRMTQLRRRRSARYATKQTRSVGSATWSCWNAMGACAATTLTALTLHWTPCQRCSPTGIAPCAKALALSSYPLE